MLRPEFIRHFRDRGISSDSAAAAYDGFRPWGVWKRFEPAASDGIITTYKIVADDDVAEVAYEILRRTGGEVPASEDLAGWDRPVETIEDLVRWVEWVRLKRVDSA
jgi:hypothetical protein